MTFKCIVGPAQPGVPQKWSVHTFPDPDREDDRPKAVATERMLFRSTGALACPVGKEYAIEDAHLMVTQEEWLGEAPVVAPEPSKRRKASK